MDTRQALVLLRTGGEADGVLAPTRWPLARAEPMEDVLFGFGIPYLPDALVSPDLSGQTDRQRLAELLARQAQLIGSLAAGKHTAFALRYVLHPEHAAVEMALLARGSFPAERADTAGLALAAQLEQLLMGFGVPLEPIHASEALLALLDPSPGGGLAEVRQREEVVQAVAGDLYAVHPFRAAPSSWVEVFRLLTQQTERCAVSIHLEPTLLLPDERSSLAQASVVAASLADYTYAGLSGQYQYRDPQARLVADLYADALQRLGNPFLLVAQVVASAGEALLPLAQALGAQVADRQTPADASRQGGPPPRGFDVVLPRTPGELEAARRTLRSLRLQVWGETLATPGKERLRYLVDAEAASALFRFPVALRGGVPGVRTRQAAPSYEVGPRPAPDLATEIPLGHFADGRGVPSIPAASLVRHVLIAGTTGYGKTTTCMHLLAELWARGVPWLVVEPAKMEYRALLRAPFGGDVRVFTLGDEGVSPFRFNPLELLPGVRVEAHVSAVRACLEAAFPTIGPLPSLLEDALLNVYQTRGWELAERAQAEDPREMPTLGDLYFEAIRVTDERGYAGEVLQNIRAAVGGRIGSLLRGSKGRMLNTRRSVPFPWLMGAPTVLELESLNDEEKALVMLLLLTVTREYCRTTRQDAQLRHVTVVEEAHRLMAATTHAVNRETSADSQAMAAGLFGAMLSEVRGFGEGMIVAEQIPIRLADDALKNTNTKIIHRLPGEDDRRAVGATMNASPEQELYIAKLEPGVAALFVSGYERPAFISVPDYRAAHGLPDRLTDDAVEARRRAFPQSDTLPLAGCQHCQRVCQYRSRVSSVAYELDQARRARSALLDFDDRVAARSFAEAWAGLAQFCDRAVRSIGLGGDPHAAYCYYTHIAPRPFSAQAADRLREALKALQDQ